MSKVFEHVSLFVSNNTSAILHACYTWAWLTEQVSVVLQLFSLSVDRGLRHHQPFLQLSVLLVAQSQIGAQTGRLLTETLLYILPELSHLAAATSRFHLLQQQSDDSITQTTTGLRKTKTPIYRECNCLQSSHLMWGRPVPRVREKRRLGLKALPAQLAEIWFATSKGNVVFKEVK